MADDVVGRAAVEILADTKKWDDTLNRLPANTGTAIKAALAKAQAALAQTKLDIQVAVKPSDIAALTAQYDKLEAQLLDVARAAVLADRAQQGGFGTPGGSGHRQGRSGAISGAALGASRLIEDVSVAGPLGGLNNVPEVVSSIGRAAGASATAVAGLTAGISILATGAYLVYQNWDKLTGLFGHTKTEAEQMDELAKATDRTAEATKKLLAYQEREAGIEGQRKAKTKAQKERAEGVEEATIESGRDEVIKGLVESGGGTLVETDRSGAARKASEELERRKKDLRTEVSGTYGGGAGASRKLSDEEYQAKLADDPEAKRLQSALNEALTKAAENLLQEAKTDPKRLNALINQVERSPGSFPEGFADELRKFTPEAIAERKGKARTKDQMGFEEAALKDTLDKRKADKDKTKDQVDFEKDALKDTLDKRKAEAKEVKDKTKDQVDFEKDALKDKIDKDKLATGQYKVGPDGKSLVKLADAVGPQVFGGVGDYLKSIQTAGVAKDQDGSEKVVKAVNDQTTEIVKAVREINLPKQPKFRRRGR